jgi:hypothetical protein
MFNPGAEFYLSHDQKDLPRELNGFKTPAVAWRVIATIGRMASDRPCWGGVRTLAHDARCNPETFAKYRDVAVSLGFFGMEPRPGIGQRHLTTLLEPLRSPVWGVFKRRTDTENRTYLSDFKSDSVKSTEAVAESATVATDDNTAETPAAPSPIDSRPTPTPTTAEKKPEQPGWQLAVFIAIVLKMLGFSLKEREGLSILKTARLRGLTTTYTADTVIAAIRDDATFRDGFDVFRPSCIRSPGRFVHARVQDIENERLRVVSFAAKSTPIEPVTGDRSSEGAISNPTGVAAACELCADTGWRQFERPDGVSYARPCSCLAGHNRRPKPKPKPAPAVPSGLERATAADLAALIPPAPPGDA